METKRSDTTVVLYFDNIGEEAVHLQMSAFQKHEVENAKPANVIIYDYYDNSKCFDESCTIIAACSNKYYSYSSSLCSIVLRDRCLISWKCLPNRKPLPFREDVLMSCYWKINCYTNLNTNAQ